MKILDGLKLPGFRVDIPEARREDLPEFFKDMGYKAGVEVGVEKGRFAETLCKSGLKIYAVDPWTTYSGYGERSMPEKVMNANYKMTRNRLAPYENCTIIRKFSADAAEMFEDNSLDFVYIDGNHGYKHVVEDLYEWSRKVRKGGAICGHDYTILSGRRKLYMDVKWAVDGYIKSAKIKKWYLLGRKHDKVRDHYRSFLWINP
jgi:hypothetical protein